MLPLSLLWKLSSRFAIARFPAGAHVCPISPARGLQITKIAADHALGSRAICALAVNLASLIAAGVENGRN